MPPRPPDDKAAVKYWEELDKLFYRTVGYAESAFRTNRWINIVVVIIGVVMIAYALIQNAIRGSDLSTIAFGGLGVADFIGLAFFTTQSKIQKTVGDLTQVQMLYRTYCNELETTLDWVRDHRSTLTLDEVTKVDDELEKRTEYATKRIEDLIGT
jgi:hypothetical protein